MMQKIWRIKESDPSISRNLASQLGISFLIAQLLINRGITDKESGYAFLHPDFSQLHSPDKMPDIDKAVQRIRHAIESHEKIWIYGDYDVDGVTSVCLLYLCLKELNADVDYHIPSRFDEGYGLNKDSIAELRRKGCELLITVDCGISTVDEVRFANESGMEVIITDHHTPHDKLPPAIAIVNPKVKGSIYPFDSLAGVGVAFKLAQALMDDHNSSGDQFLLKNLDLVALGTIVDIVPLTGENRVIASLGLKALNESERPGIKALWEIARIKQESINSHAVGFQIGPRLNAAGRMDTAINAVKLLLSESYEEALEIAQKLDSANKERQSIERGITDNARKQVQQLDVAHLKALVLSGENWHQGAIGIAASKIQEQFHRPTVLISIEGDMARGSARSIPSFDIHDAIAKCGHYLERYGGHKGAAGFNIAKDNIEKFRKEFLKIAFDTIAYDDLKPQIDIDARMSLADLTMEAVEDLALLEPYGLGNPQPLIAVNGLSIKGLPRVVGRANEHLQITVSDGQETMRTIAYNMGKLERDISEKNTKIDVICKPQINEWNDTKNVELKIEDIMIHHGDSPEVTVASAEIRDPIQIKIEDHRGTPDKKKHLRKLIQTGEKSLFYVRDDSAIDQLIKIIKPIIPENDLEVCYSTTTEDESDKIKSMFIDNKLKIIISSVPIKKQLTGLKHLVFCHPVSTKDVFVSSCSPVIEASDKVHIHLIFNNNDIDLLTTNLNQQYPDRQLLVNVYKKIKDLYKDEPISFDTVLNGMKLDEPKDLVVSRCIDIFEELSFVKRQLDDGKITISLLPEPDKRRNLNESQIYSDGNRIKSEWAEFSRFISSKTAEEIRKMIIDHF
jgi:single-stranded-DNA-specific exonuclease